MIYLVFNVLYKNDFKNIRVFNTNGFYFVEHIFIATGTSLKHIKFSSSKLLNHLDKYYNSSCQLSGLNTEWLIMDFNVIIIHLMLDHSRLYYELDAFYAKQFNEVVFL